MSTRAASTIERWYYTARSQKDDPIGVLRRAVRKDCSKVSLDPALAELLFRQYHDHAHWELGRVRLVDPRTGTTLAALYPLDRKANADGQRKLFELEADDESADAEKQADKPLPPLLRNTLAEYSATGMPPAYLPKKPRAKKGRPS